LAPTLSIIVAARARKQHLARASAARRPQTRGGFAAALAGDGPDAAACGAPPDFAAGPGIAAGPSIAKREGIAVGPDLAVRPIYQRCAEANMARARNIAPAGGRGAPNVMDRAP
jgi:hypothetical protein